MGEETRRGFQSRWGLIATLIGLAIGTGNIWRFPRQAASNGGGAFIIAWTVMLLVTAIPLAIAEMAIGRAARRGCPHAFRDMLGKRYTWMGCFMSLIVLCIASYYTVTMAWVLRYLIMSFTGSLFTAPDKEALWYGVSTGSPLTVACFGLSLLLTWFITSGGVSGSIEQFMERCIPVLFVLLAVIAVRVLFLGRVTADAAGTAAGLDFFFRIDPAYLWNGRTWINALIQILWSVGVGWGLVITYGVYTQPRTDVALNAFIQGFGNNVASLLAGVAVIPTLFAFYSPEKALAICSSGNNGLTFISLAHIFGEMPGGRLIAILFFLALLLAALSSNLGHFLVMALPLMDMGMDRKKANRVVLCLIAVWGLPSALFLDFHGNQDFVSGIGLVLGILWTCVLVRKTGVKRFADRFVNIPENDVHCGLWWRVAIRWIAPLTATLLIAYFAVGYLKQENRWNIWQTESFATLAVQLAVYLAAANLWAAAVNRKQCRVYYNGESFPEVPEDRD